RRQLDRDLVPREDTDIVHAHLSGDVSQNDVSVLQLDAEGRVGEGFHDLPLHLDHIFFGHCSPLSRPHRVGIPTQLWPKLAFFTRLSYWRVMMYACTWDMKSMVTKTMIRSEVPPK